MEQGIAVSLHRFSDMRNRKQESTNERVKELTNERMNELKNELWQEVFFI